MTAAPYLDRATIGAKGLVDALRERGFGDDDDLILDSLEGETDAMEAVSRLLRWMGERQAMGQALKALEGDYASRRKRYEEAVASARGALSRFMTEIGVKKIERPEATVSMRESGPVVVYPGDFNPETLPEKYRRWTCEADKAAIREAMLAGGDIPGLALSNSEPTLAVRVK